MKKIISCVLIFFISSAVFAKSRKTIDRTFSGTLLPLNKRFQEMILNLPENFFEPDEIKIFRLAYPDVVFSTSFDKEKNDWKIDMSVPKSQKLGAELKTTAFWWCGGRILPEEEIQNIESYQPVLYRYPRLLEDPKDFDEERIRRVKEYSSRESRKNGAGTPPFFFDFLYSADSQRIIESHIIQVRFLGHKTRIHERIKTPLKNVELKIESLADTDEETKNFVDSIKSSAAYNWRIIAGTRRKSFHSYGIAVDVIPKRLGGKAIFWSWEKDRNPNGWMVLPLSRRWSPPDSVIEIFESEGFIWGEKWGIWDNMHFEYHPELILQNFGLDALG